PVAHHRNESGRDAKSAIHASSIRRPKWTAQVTFEGIPDARGLAWRESPEWTPVFCKDTSAALCALVPFASPSTSMIDEVASCQTPSDRSRMDTGPRFFRFKITFARRGCRAGRLEHRPDAGMGIALSVLLDVPPEDGGFKHRADAPEVADGSSFRTDSRRHSRSSDSSKKQETIDAQPSIFRNRTPRRAARDRRRFPCAAIGDPPFD
ncbi:hypothetical protein, partial [Burkholderia cenocepacia]|uniref:hypothetical protein n=1 Tax=Burkholderia cenocepacia TaxID=95486 RepID=UPI002AB6E4EC